MALRVDLNSDLGEGAGHDEELLGGVTSANIACGFHAGDAHTIARTAKLAAEKGVALGAHPGLPDRKNFGRLPLDLDAGQVREIVLYQAGALQAFAKALGQPLRHVKPHGALYHMANARPDVARAIAEAVRALDARLLLFAQAGGGLASAGRATGLTVIEEAFADRRYRVGGMLLSREKPGAVLTEIDEAVVQAVRLVKEGKVRTVDGADIPVRADTLCIHGDEPRSPELLQRLRAAFEREGIDVRGAGKP